MCPDVCFERLQPSQNCSKWCIIADDPDFGDFWGPKFTGSSVERSGRKYFGKSIVGAFKYRTCNSFSYLVLFLENWNRCYCLTLLEFSSLLRIVFSWNFCNGGLARISLELKWFVLPANSAYFLRYPVFAIYVTFLIWPDFQRLSRLGDRTLWIRHATYVINQFTFVEKIFAAEPSICSFGIRTAFLPIDTN